MNIVCARVLPFLVVIPTLVFSGCGGSSSHETATNGQSAPASSSGGEVGMVKADAKTPKAPGEAKVGDVTRCPVSGDSFTVTEQSPHAEYNGKTYYFCCEGCSEEFNANPAKFTGASSKP